MKNDERLSLNKGLKTDKDKYNFMKYFMSTKLSDLGMNLPGSLGELLVKLGETKNVNKK